MDFMNHHTDFTVNHTATERDGEKWLVASASRAIQAGQELTIDYMNRGLRAIGDAFEQYGFTVPAKQLPEASAGERCASVLAGADDLLVLKEALAWSPPEQDTELSEQEAAWAKNVGRSRAEEIRCVEAAFVEARKQATDPEARKALQELLGEPATHEEL